jgi:hypothetical protein
MNYAMLTARRRRTPVPLITITSQPQGVTSGGEATFSVSAAASDGSTLQYQWQVSTDSGATFSDVSGEVSSSLALSGLTVSESGNQYRVLVSAAGAATVPSNAATYTFTVVVSITQQPNDQLASGGAATFTAAAATNDGSSVSYQWQLSTNNGASYSDVSGATSSTLSLTSLQSSANGRRYRVVASAAGATSVTSNAATLIVLQPSVSITQQPPQLSTTHNNNLEINGYQAAGTLLTAAINNADQGSTLTYNWQISETGSGGWQNLSDVGVWSQYFGYAQGQTENNLIVGYKGIGPTSLTVYFRCQVGVSPTGTGATSNTLVTVTFMTP